MPLGADGLPVYVGPRTEAQKRAWDEARAGIADCDAEIACNIREARRYPEHARFCHNEIAWAERRKAFIAYVLPDEATRRRHGYRKPSEAEIDAFQAQTKRRYRLFDELTLEEQQRAIARLVAGPGRRAKRGGD